MIIDNVLFENWNIIERLREKEDIFIEGLREREREKERKRERGERASQ